VRIVDVLKDTPASRAGLRPDDIIFALHGHPIRSTNELLTTIAKIAPETKVAVEIERNGARRTMQVVLNQRPPARERR
jgi:S1-C subfamily serine protease